MGNTNQQATYPAWNIIRGANLVAGITSTLVGADQCLDVNVVGGGAGGGPAQLQVTNGAGVWTDVGYFAGDLNVPVQLEVPLVSEYQDDTGFTVETDWGQAVGGIATGDQVAGGEFGVFAMTTHREQRVSLSRGGWEVSVQPTWIAATQDEATNSLAVGAGCFGYYGAGAANTRMRPLLMDLEDDAVASGQLLQTVIPLNYYYDTGEEEWKRVTGAAGALNVTVGNFPASQTVDDGGGSLTVDGTVTANQGGVWNIGTLTTITNPVPIESGTTPSTEDPDTINVGRMKKHRVTAVMLNGTNSVTVWFGTGGMRAFRGKILKIVIEPPNLEFDCTVDMAAYGAGVSYEEELLDYTNTTNAWKRLYVRQQCCDIQGTALANEYAPMYVASSNIRVLLQRAAGNVTANRTWYVTIFYEE